MCKTMLVVVLYDKIYKDSLTLKCLMSNGYADVDLCIINTGPISLEFDKEFIHTLGFFVKNITISESLDDRPLSSVFNSVINEYCDFERFIFFDDESTLCKRYIKKLDLYYSEDVDLQIPNIRGRMDKKVHYPIISETARKFNEGVKINQGHILRTIGSGLVVYRSLIDKFAKIGAEIFDGEFTLTDVNHNFFVRLESLRLEKVKVVIQIVNTLEHSLHRTDLPSKKRGVIARLRENISSMKTYFNHFLMMT